MPIGSTGNEPNHSVVLVWLKEHVYLVVTITPEAERVITMDWLYNAITSLDRSVFREHRLIRNNVTITKDEDGKIQILLYYQKFELE